MALGPDEKPEMALRFFLEPALGVVCIQEFQFFLPAP